MKFRVRDGPNSEIHTDAIMFFTFSEKFWSIKIERLLDPVYKAENTAAEIRHADHVAPSIHKSWQ
jgi:hypothetical protein